MDLGTLVRVVLRRWYVAGPILVITAVLAMQTYQSVRPTYEGVSQVLLLAPNARFDETELNPYASFDRGIDVTAQAMALILTSSDSRESLASEGLIGAYTVAPNENGPILLIRTRSRNPDLALDTLDGVVERLREVLAEEQAEAGAPSTQLITANVLSRSPRPNVLYAARDRSLAAIVGLGVIAAIASVLVIESLADRRRRVATDDTSTDSVSAAPPGPAGVAAAASPFVESAPAVTAPVDTLPADLALVDPAVVDAVAVDTALVDPALVDAAPDPDPGPANGHGNGIANEKAVANRDGNGSADGKAVANRNGNGSADGKAVANRNGNGNGNGNGIANGSPTDDPDDQRQPRAGTRSTPADGPLSEWLS